MYQLLYFLLNMVAVLGIMSLDSMELTPPSRLQSSHLGHGGRRCWDVVHVDCLVSDLFSVGIQRRETICHLSHSFERRLVLHGKGVIIFPRGMKSLGVADALLDVVSLLYSITFLTIDVALRPRDYFGKCECRLLVEGFIEVYLFKSILEYPHKHFLV